MSNAPLEAGLNLLQVFKRKRVLQWHCASKLVYSIIYTAGTKAANPETVVC